MWRKFVWSALSSYANSLAVMSSREDEALMVAEVIGRLRDYGANISSSLVSVVEKLSREFQQLKEDMSYSPPLWSSVSAVRNKHPLAQRRGNTPWDTLWFYLRDHGEDMRRWDGKPTSTLQAAVCELQGKQSLREALPGKLLLQFPVSRSPDRGVEVLILFLSLTERLLSHIYRK